MRDFMVYIARQYGRYESNVFTSMNRLPTVRSEFEIDPTIFLGFWKFQRLSPYFYIHLFRMCVYMYICMRICLDIKHFGFKTAV